VQHYRREAQASEFFLFEIEPQGKAFRNYFLSIQAFDAAGTNQTFELRN
jgi:hypothetical protein